MSHYEYKVVPAPKRAKRVRGVKAAEELFALTLTDAINEVARQGWEYVRAEHLSAEAPGGWFRGGTAGEQAVLVFRRQREALGPRLATLRVDHDGGGPAGVAPPVAGVAERASPERAAVERATAERATAERVQEGLRHREPLLRAGPPVGEAARTDVPAPLRPGPKLGPA
ncbi:MAG TPA: hypothetical protein VFN28_11670, partial [Amaricoccus sp.]|nr:hypothetical protein [Amaricoccus sp.]